MTTTRTYAQWTASTSSGRPALDVLTSVAGDFADDYDLEAAESAFLSRINMGMPPGFHMARNGELFGPADSTWIEDNFENPEEVNLLDGIEDVDVWAILERHERTPKTDFERAQQLLLRFVDKLLPYTEGDLTLLMGIFRRLVENGSNPDGAVAMALSFDALAPTAEMLAVTECLEYAAERFPHIPREAHEGPESGQLTLMRDYLGEAEIALHDLQVPAQ